MSGDAFLFTVNLAGPVILFIVWSMARNRSAARRLVACAWGIVMAVAGAIGMAQYMILPYSRGTLLCYSVMMASSCYLLGPFLILSAGTRWHWAWSILAAVILVPVSYIAALAIMLETGQAAWG